jgi:hypothetical protein
MSNISSAEAKPWTPPHIYIHTYIYICIYIYMYIEKDTTVTHINTKQAGSPDQVTNASTVQVATTCKRTGKAVQLNLFKIGDEK